MKSKMIVGGFLVMGMLSVSAISNAALVSPSGAEFVMSEDGNSFIDVTNQMEYIRPDYFLTSPGATTYFRQHVTDLEFDGKLFNTQNVSGYTSLISTFFGVDYSHIADFGTYQNAAVRENGSIGDDLIYRQDIVDFINLISFKAFGALSTFTGVVDALPDELPSAQSLLWLENDLTPGGKFLSSGSHVYQFIDSATGELRQPGPYTSGIDFSFNTQHDVSLMIGTSSGSLLYVRDISDLSTVVEDNSVVSNDVSVSSAASSIFMLLCGLIGVARKRKNV